MKTRLEFALMEARERAGGVGSEMYLAKLGSLLKKAGVQTEEKLSVLLRQMPEFCVIDGESLRFLDGPPSTSMLAGPKYKTFIARELHLALISDHNDRRAFIDLESLDVVTVPLEDGEPTPPVSDEPLRYLAVPTLSTAEQREFATKFLGDALDEEQQLTLKRAGFSWMKALRPLISDERMEQLQDARWDWVLAHALEWMNAHRLPVERLTSRRPVKAPKLQHAEASAGRLRRLVHACVDAMTEPELAALPLPARVLLQLNVEL